MHTSSKIFGNALSTTPEMPTGSEVAHLQQESKGMILKRLKEMPMSEDARQLYVAAFAEVSDRSYEAPEIQKILDRAISDFNDDAKADMHIDAAEVLTMRYPRVPASPSLRGPVTISGAGRAPESSFYYILTGMRTLLAAAALAVAAAGTSVAGGGSNQALWVANGTNVVEFANLPPGTHDEKPTLELNSAVFGTPQGVAFDRSNNLWVIDGGTVAAGGTIPPSLDEFTEAQLKNLKKDPMPSPNVQITSGDLVFPQQAVFDASGNMWVSDNMADKVFVITPAQLAAGGDIPFTTTIESDPAFTGPLGIALHDGNLYIANNGTTTIFEFNANHLPAIGSGVTTLVPDVTLDDDGNNSIQAPWALVFDAAGDLWSSNANAPFTLVKFGPNQIGSTGDPTPEITISPVDEKVGKNTDPTLTAPNGIAFDDKGNLVAISSATPFGVARYNSTQQMMGGAVKPGSLVVGAKTTLNAPAGDVFGPTIGNGNGH